MITNQEHKSKTFDTVLQNPEMVHFHESIRFVQSTPFDELFPKKYEMAKTSFARRKTISLFNENPTLPLKIVLTTVLENMSNELPAPLILKITQNIIEKWESLLANHQQDNPLVAAT